MLKREMVVAKGIQKRRRDTAMTSGFIPLERAHQTTTIVAQAAMATTAIDIHQLASKPSASTRSPATSSGTGGTSRGVRSSGRGASGLLARTTCLVSPCACFCHLRQTETGLPSEGAARDPHPQDKTDRTAHSSLDGDRLQGWWVHGC